MDTSAPTAFVINGVVADLSAETLHGPDGVAIALRPQAFAVLAYMLRNPHRIVTKRELMEAIWPATAVTDDSLVQCIHEIRRAIHDERQTVLETASRRGYRLIATSGDAAGANIAANNEPGPSALRAVPMRSHTSEIRTPSLVLPRRIWMAVAAGLGLFALMVLVLAIIATTVAWNDYWREPACALASEKPSIAVLPFDYVGEDPKRLRIADGLSEDVIGNLSRLGDLFVIAGNSTRIYKGGVTDVAKVGCDLGVTYVLQGSIQDSGARILVKPQLVEATNKRLVWSETFDRSPDDVLRVQDELTASIAARLLGYERGLPEEKRNKLPRKPSTHNLEAYDYYLQAETLGRGWDTTQNKALVLYQKAIELDPKFADAYAGYARIVADVWLRQLETVRPIPVARKEAYEAASRALALDAENPRPYFILSTLQSADGRHDQAIDSARQGISLQPNNAEGYGYLAGALTFAGRHSEALAAMEAALRMDPNPPPQFRADFGWVLFHNHDYERALHELEKAREGGVRYLETIAAVYVKLGRPAEARSAVREMLAVDDTVNLELVRVQYSHFKRKEDLDQLIEALREAGVSEWPYGYRAQPELRLDASEVAALTFGRRWTGQRLHVGPFVQEISQNGTLAYRDQGNLVTGSASVEGDALCQRSEAVLMDRKHCGGVYRNPVGTPSVWDEYVYLSPRGIYRFTVVK
jgi:TolB-like protein/DNA-binding winged helix-turn-helix (wHTH) protein/cytochrome c-type biogenesis protein CcmH/NrfG